MIIQLNPPIPLNTSKGEGLAYALIDYGIEFNLMWVVAIDETGEIWTFPNPKVRALKNISYGRFCDEGQKAGDPKRDEGNGKEDGA